MEELKKGYQIYKNTVLLFKTFAPKKRKTRNDEVIEPDAADYDHYPARWGDTVLVKIRSRAQLKMDVLDRMAHIGEDYEQDMPADDVEYVAKTIGKAIGDWGSGAHDYSWARGKSLRSRSRIKRSKVAAERELIQLHHNRNRIIGEVNRRVEVIDKRIEKINKLHEL
tara:strand:- start:170 stop:670 length:501 start_codon:yes stop_codon:yes gene_type:complete